MKRSQLFNISPSGHQALAQYEDYLRTGQDLRPATVRNYLSDLRLFVAWCEEDWFREEAAHAFNPAVLTTPLLTRYRSFLQQELGLKPNSINRCLVSLKKYSSWVAGQGLIARDPARVVKLVDQQTEFPRQLSDAEEEALVAAVEAGGNVRDRTIIILMLHSGLRAGEICRLKTQAVKQRPRSGSLIVVGKGNKYREVPLNSTARKAIEEYKAKLPIPTDYLFVSEKTGTALTERGLGYLVKKYTKAAKLDNLSPHDLRHRFGYRMAEKVPLHRLAQIMGHDSLDTTLLYIKATKKDLQQEVEKIAWG